MQFGASAALHEAITLEDGKVSQANFNDYPVLRIPESPAIQVQIIDSTLPPSGAGEIAVPVAAPPLAGVAPAL